MRSTDRLPAVFATTRWTLIGHVAGGPQSAAALDELLAIYWKPLHRLRKRYRLLLKEEISRTHVDPKQVDEELRALFTTLAG